MGVIHKKVSGENDKKKNKVKNNIKSKLETNTKFPKAKNSDKPAGPIATKSNDKSNEGAKKKKFEKKLKRGSLDGNNSNAKQDGNKASPNPKKNKKNKKAKQTTTDKKQVKIDVDDFSKDTPLTAEETKTAVISAKLVKKDTDQINKILTDILKNSDIKQEDQQTKPIVDGLQLDELISKDKLKKQVKSFMKVVKNAKAQPDYKTNLVNDKRLITLSVLAMKIPDCVNKNAKIKLPVPLYTTDSEICLFVADLERGRKRDDEPFVRHYEAILEKNGVTCINKIMTTSHLIKEYSTYELKFRLANTYDVFLVEGKVSNRVGKCLGKIFSEIKRNPIVVRDFTQEAIESALSTVTYRQSGLGPVNVINFAYDTMIDSQITDNLYDLIQQLRKVYPGGWANIKSLTLTALKELAFPIMCNFALPNDIPVPKLKNDRDIKVLKAKALLDGALQKIEITGNGVLVKTKRKRDESELLSNSGNEELDDQVVPSIGEEGSLSKPKKKKKKHSEKEPPAAVANVETEPEHVVIIKKDKKKKKNKDVVVAEQQEPKVDTLPEPVVLSKKQKKKNNNVAANSNGLKSNKIINNKPSQNSNFEKSTDAGKPKKKKFNKVK